MELPLRGAKIPCLVCFPHPNTPPAKSGKMMLLRFEISLLREREHNENTRTREHPHNYIEEPREERTVEASTSTTFQYKLKIDYVPHTP
jgi:hypothetical protein